MKRARLDPVGSQQAPRGRSADPGREPPLDLSGAASPKADRRDVNLRWLAGSLLTGFTGAGLIA